MEKKRPVPASNFDTTTKKPKKKRKGSITKLEPAADSNKQSTSTRQNQPQPSIFILGYIDSVFDGMREEQMARSLARYYENPNLLPNRESEAERRLRLGRLPSIGVNFDENIFQRSTPLRPVPEDEKYGIDPFETTSPGEGVPPKQVDVKSGAAHKQPASGINKK